MHISLKFGAILAFLGSPAMAAAQTKSACVTDTEARALFAYMMPEALDGVMKTCKPTLSPTSYLATRGDETVIRYRAAAASSWTAARGAFLKVAGEKDEGEIIAKMSDAALKPFVSEAFAGVVAKDVKASDCPKIDRFVAALAPMAPENVAELIAALVGLVGGKEKEDLNLC
jgi:hypothetical protein